MRVLETGNINFLANETIPKPVMYSAGFQGHIFINSRHFGLVQMGKLRGTCHNGRNSAVQFSQRSWAVQYKKCVLLTSHRRIE